MNNLLLIVACLILNVTMAQETTTIYLIRHAEKANDGTADPSLSEAGKERTKVWGKYFEDKNIHIYYTTPYKRTTETASFTSSYLTELPRPGTSKNIRIKAYDPMALSLKQVAEENKGRNIVIVGHSNTIPAQVNALLGQRVYTDMPESDYGNLYIIKITGDKITHELVKM